MKSSIPENQVQPSPRLNLFTSEDEVVSDFKYLTQSTQRRFHVFSYLWLTVPHIQKKDNDVDLLGKEWGSAVAVLLITRCSSHSFKEFKDVKLASKTAEK